MNWHPCPWAESGNASAGWYPRRRFRAEVWLQWNDETLFAPVCWWTVDTDSCRTNLETMLKIKRMFAASQCMCFCGCAGRLAFERGLGVISPCMCGMVWWVINTLVQCSTYHPHGNPPRRLMTSCKLSDSNPQCVSLIEIAHKVHGESL